MPAQAVDFLVHVQPLRQDREFLLQPVLVHVGDQLRDALQQPRAHARPHLGQPIGDASREFDQPGAALLQGIAQPAALAVAKARELRQRVGEQCVSGGDHGRGIAGGVPDHPGPAQQVQGVDARRRARL